MLFADNFWLFATSPHELTQMGKLWLRLLQRAGWQAPADEMTWCTSAADNEVWRVVLADFEVARSPRNLGFKALGVQITFDNRFNVELEARIKAAWRSFYKFADLLMCKSAPLGKRLKLMGVVIPPSLFWCAGSWNLIRTQLEKLRGVQLRMIRKMIGPRRQDGESLADFMHRSNASIKHLMSRHGVEHWDAHYHRLQFSWAGDVARMATLCPKRLTYAALKHRDISWIHKMAEQYRGNQQHCRKLHTWRWERCLFKYSCSWQQDAQDKHKWQKSLDEMVQWRCTHR